MARLRERADARVVAVAEIGGEGQAVGIELDARRDDGPALHRRAASQRSSGSRTGLSPR